MKSIYRILTFVACVAVFSQCADDGEYDHPIVYDNIPEVPVLFTGAKTQGANPYYEVVFAGNTTPISITLSVPAEAGVTITEITKAIAGATSISAGGLASSVNANPPPAGVQNTYFLGAVAVGAGTYTINTTVAAFNANNVAGAANDITQANVDTAAPTATPYVERAFMLQLLMSDGSTIVPQQVRLRFKKS